MIRNELSFLELLFRASASSMLCVELIDPVHGFWNQGSFRRILREGK